jgi:hypothetical protein
MRRAATAMRGGVLGVAALLLIVLAPSGATAQADDAAHSNGNSACTHGLDALPFTSPRARVLADGSAAAELAIACAGHGGVQRLEVAPLFAHAWTKLAARASGKPALQALQLKRSARARARARRDAAGRERYDLIVLSPEGTPAGGALDVLVPRIRSETVEGISELLDALSSEGALVGWLQDEPSALRFALTAMESLRAHGVARPSARVVVQRARHRHAVWVSPEPIATDTLLALHERDLARRQRMGQRAQPEREVAEPVLLHTPVAIFPNPFSQLLAAHGGPDPRSTPPAYAFDIAPVRDDRPLFFERTRRDLPDTWTSNGAYVGALVMLTAALVAGLVGLRAALRARARIASPAGRPKIGSAILLGLAHGGLLAWSAQATSRLLADTGTGLQLTPFGLAVGGAVSFALARRASGRLRTLVAGAAALCFALAGLAASRWRELPIVAFDDARWACVALCVLLGAAAAVPLALVMRSDTATAAPPRVRAITVACYAAALLLAVPVVAATALFADYRAVGISFAVTGAIAAMLTARDRPRARS